MFWNRRFATLRQRHVLGRHGKAGAPGLGLWWTFAAALVAVAAIIVAIVQNGGNVQVHYLAWHVHVSLIVVVLTTALVAILLDQAGGLIWRARRRSRLHRRSELAQLRAQRRPPEEISGPARQPAPRAEADALPAPPAAPDILS